MAKAIEVPLHNEVTSTDFCANLSATGCTRNERWPAATILKESSAESRIFAAGEERSFALRRLAVKKAQADVGRESVEATSMRESQQIDAGRSSSDKSSGTR